MSREPWHVETRGDWVKVRDGEGWTVAKVSERDPADLGDAHLLAAAPHMADALDAVLLWHGGGDWTAAKAARWADLVGKGVPATTKALCDFVRGALAAAGAPPAPCPRGPHPSGPGCGAGCDNRVPGDDDAPPAGMAPELRGYTGRRYPDGEGGGP